MCFIPKLKNVQFNAVEENNESLHIIKAYSFLKEYSSQMFQTMNKLS